MTTRSGYKRMLLLTTAAALAVCNLWGSLDWPWWAILWPFAVNLAATFVWVCGRLEDKEEEKCPPR